MTTTLPGATLGLQSLVDLLWPAATHERNLVRQRGSTPPGSLDYLVLPSRHNPRLLLPAEAEFASAGLVHTSAKASKISGLSRRALAVPLRLGLHRLAPLDRLRIRPTTTAPAGVTGLVSHVVDHTELPVTWIASRLGSDRPNRKPVVLLGDDANTPRAFAKIGWRPLTARLVIHEAAVLQALEDRSDLKPVRAPRVLDDTPWEGTPVLTLEALPIPAIAGSIDNGTLVEVIRAIAGSESHSMSATQWIANDLSQRLAEFDTEPDARRIRALLATLVARHSPLFLTLADWHGDLRPWNMASTDGSVLVWDWERHASHRPLGLDAIHHGFPLPQTTTPLRRWLDDAHAAAQQAVPVLAGLDVPVSTLAVLRGVHAAELWLRSRQDRAVQPDVARPDHEAALIDLLASLE